MTTFLRYLLFFLLYAGVLSIERTLGLPLISFVLASNYLATSGKIGKTIGIIIGGILLSTSYLIPFWLGILLLAGLVFALEQQLILFHRETLTYFGFIVLAAVILGVVSHFPLSIANGIYHVTLAVLCLFTIRFWFTKRTNKWKTY